MEKSFASENFGVQIINRNSPNIKNKQKNIQYVHNSDLIQDYQNLNSKIG